MSSESDVEMQSALPKKTKMKTPKSPTVDFLTKTQDPKKISTRDMIKEALHDLKSRKGTSLYAIKKYITEKHNVNVDRINYIIKKNIKIGIEDGTILQTKGIGASGSFKLAPKKKPEPGEKPKKKIANKPKKTENPEKVKKTKKGGDMKEKDTKKIVKKKIEAKGGKTTKKVEKKGSKNEEKPTKTKMAKEMQTPAKKRAAMMKRKSIGSIIKPPKMKPKAKA